MIVELLNCQGFAGHFDFVYAPVDFQNCESLRYASVNMTSHGAAASAISRLHGIMVWEEEELEVSWSLPLQGLASHIRRYQNSPVMHTCVPDEYKPVILRNGVRQPFPAPTRSIKKPRMRNPTVRHSFA